MYIVSQKNDLFTRNIRDGTEHHKLATLQYPRNILESPIASFYTYISFLCYRAASTP